MTQLTQGVYTIPATEYHADPCPAPSLSASMCKILLAKTPAHARLVHPRLNPNYAADNHKDYDVGSAAHAMLLEGLRPFEIISAKDFRTDAAKAARDAAYATGKIPLLEKQLKPIEEMVAAARYQIDNHDDARGAFVEGKGKPEQTLIWQERGIWCRARLDWLPDELHATKIFHDYKTTTNANPDNWQNRVDDMRHDISAAFYRRGIKAVFGIEMAEMQFIVQETEAPYALSVCQLAPDYYETADWEIDRAMDQWRSCLDAGQWPGYPARTCWIGLKPWQEARRTETRDRAENNPTVRAIAMEMNRP